MGNRGKKILKSTFLLVKGSVKSRKNLYNAETNPTGCINLGRSENSLVLDLLKERFNQYNFQWEKYMFSYNSFEGSLELRKAVAEFLTSQTKPPSPLDYNKILVLNGGGSCMEALAFALLDPGDGVMVPTPYYGGINKYMMLRPTTRIVPVHFYSKPEKGQSGSFRFTAAKLESVYQEQRQKGINIRAFVFVNPNNPLGDVYTKQEILDVVHFCNRHNLELIANEVYMDTIFRDGIKHHSILGLEGDEIPDKRRVHFVWSASKGMAMSGMRFGVIHTWNEKVWRCVDNFAYFQSVPVYVQAIMTRFLSDRDWLNNVFFPTSHLRLRQAHKLTTDALDAIGVPYLDRPAGLNVYANFRQFMPSISAETEQNLFYRFIEAGAYIAPAQAFYADELGWFRVLFAVPEEQSKLATERIAKTCEVLLQEKTSTIALM